MKYLKYFQYNSVLILSYFFISLLALWLNKLTKGKTNKWLFSSYRSSLWNPLTYVRLFTHCIGHENWQHFSNNFLYILLIGPMIEEKYGSLNLLTMLIVTSGVTGLINTVLSENRILGASGNVFMMIIISSFVNIQSGKIPLTLILIFIFYIVNEIFKGVFKDKKDRVSHLGHLIGATCGVLFGFFVL